MVAFGAVAVFSALRRTFVIHTGLKIVRLCCVLYHYSQVHLPGETITRAWCIITVALIVNGPDTGGSLWPEVESENVEILPSSNVIALF